MAKRVVYERYTFTPSTRTIVVTGKWIRREQLLLITNVTRGTVIYNFSDPSLGYTSFTPTISGGTESTTIVVSFDTTGHSSTDYLSILVEESNTAIEPSETLLDPVGKLRTSTPQALIDTDFEYGLQPTKWEAITTLSGRAGPYIDTAQPYTSFKTSGGFSATITGMTASGTTVTVATAGTDTAATFAANLANNSNQLVVTSVTTGGPLRVGQIIYNAGNLTTGTVFITAGVVGGGAGTYTISATYGGATITGGAFTASMLTMGQPIFVQGTTQADADGWWCVRSSVPGTNFTYNTIASLTPGAIWDANKTYVYPGRFFSSAPLALAAATGSISGTGSVTTVTTLLDHGLQVGNDIFLIRTSDSTNLNGTFRITSTPTKSTFTFASAYNGSAATYIQGASLYIRPQGYVTHRAFDGGVQFTNQTPAHGYQVIRQTRRYFRYQSGKGIQFSTGTILKPSVQLTSLTHAGGVVTATSRQTHGFGVGSSVVISGADQSQYNGTYTVATVPSTTTFTYNVVTQPAVTPATAYNGGILNAVIGSYYGGTLRIGLFDQQNGAFFEFDGQNLYAVRRTSTRQIRGLYTSSITASTSNALTITAGTGGVPLEELLPGDWIVVRGVSYQVANVTSTTITLTTPWRGTTVMSNMTVSKTVDTRVAQSAWNIDRMDGTGASGFNIDLTKMQMLYIDYSWYGAGAIRWGLKNNRGEVIYCHRMVNNNLNTEAYMRSGNLPARYETNTLPPYTYVNGTFGAAATTLPVGDSTIFPATGTVVVESNTAVSGAIEYVTYTTNSANTLGGLTRAVTGGAATAQNFGTGATNGNKIKVSLYSPSDAPTVSHWGSSVIMDGRYDDDKAFVFNVGLNAAVSNLTPAGTRRPLIALRVAPSVDNGLTGSLLSVREIINRMQMTLRSVDVATTGSGVMRIDLMLNPILTSGSVTWSAVGGSSLAQYAIFAGTENISGGESIASFFAVAAGVTAQDLTLVRDLGSNIIGGGTTSTVARNLPDSDYFQWGAQDLYPDGPDVLVLCATPTNTTNTIQARISWTEAQA